MYLRVPSSRSTVTPAQASALRWWLAVDLLTGSAIAPQLSSPGQAASWRTISRRTGSDSAWSTATSSIAARSGGVVAGVIV